MAGEKELKILAIDTSNKALAVALWEDGVAVGSHLTNIKKNHSILLMPVIQQLMQEVNWQPQDLQRIVVAAGPGSYTGLRIGVTTAKTLAWTLGCPLVGISSLKVIAANCIGTKKVIVPLFNARRDNVYTGAYVWQAGELTNVHSDRHASLVEWLTFLKAEGLDPLFVGEDVAQFKATITAFFPAAESVTTASWQVPNGLVLAELGAKTAPVQDVKAFVPIYLKRVEAEEKWLAAHPEAPQSEEGQNYVEKI